MIPFKETIKIFLTIITLFVVIFSFDKCATIGTPTGGDKDTIPPEVVFANPEFYKVNFDAKRVNIGFNEYVQLKNLEKELIISPPFEKKPQVYLKGKGIYFEINREELIDSSTYTFNFGNAIADVNEGNPYTNFSYIFSTGPVIDSFGISGKVVSAFNLQPSKEPFWVMLYDNLEDSVPYKEKPVYVSRSMENGSYNIDHIKAGTYKLFALKEKNQNFLYDKEDEIIGFSDSLITIDSSFFQVKHFHDTLHIDSLNTDSLKKDETVFKIYGYHHNIFTFSEPDTDTLQYLDSWDLIDYRMFYLAFNNPLSDSFNVTLQYYPELTNWNIREFSKDKDSVNYWITDTMLLASDTLNIIVQYYKHDSLRIPVLTKDTLKFRMKRKAESQNRRGREKQEKEVRQIENLELKFNIRNNSNIEFYDKILINSVTPFQDFDTSRIEFVQIIDTLSYKKDFSIERDSILLNRLHFNFKIEESTKYKITFYDSAFSDIYGIINDTTYLSFSTKRIAQYGILNINMSGINEQIILQLLDTKEKVINEKILTNDDVVTFEYLSPSEYKLKVIFDENKNGKWDTGIYLKNLLPEKVQYFKNTINVRENWEHAENWDLLP